MSGELALKWQDTDSSNVQSVAYDEQSMTLAVRFLGGGLYTYDGVGEQVYTGLLTADSVGRYLNQAIKGSYPYLKHDSTEALTEHIRYRRENS